MKEIKSTNFEILEIKLMVDLEYLLYYHVMTKHLLDIGHIVELGTLHK